MGSGWPNKGHGALLSIAPDPNLATNGYVYLHFTYENNPAHRPVLASGSTTCQDGHATLTRSSTQAVPAAASPPGPRRRELLRDHSYRGSKTDTKSIKIYPQTVRITFATKADWLRVVYDGTGDTVPLSRTTIVGSTHTIYAPSPQNW